MAIEHLMVAAPVEKIEVGAEYDLLPARMAVFPWFAIATDNWTLFDREMQKLVQEAPRPTVRGVDQSFISSAGEGAISVLERQTRTFKVDQYQPVHEGVLSAVRRYGDNFDPNSVGKNWHPHIEHMAEFQLDLEEEIELEQLAVFRTQKFAQGFTKSVKALYLWGDASNE